jgi:hypothetical protein
MKTTVSATGVFNILQSSRLSGRGSPILVQVKGQKKNFRGLRKVVSLYKPEVGKDSPSVSKVFWVRKRATQQKKTAGRLKHAIFESTLS